MTTDFDPRRDKKPGFVNDDAVKVLTDILNQVRSGFQPRPISPEAEAAIAVYNDLRRTLDHERTLTGSIGSTPIK